MQHDGRRKEGEICIRRGERRFTFALTCARPSLMQTREGMAINNKDNGWFWNESGKRLFMMFGYAAVVEILVG